MSTNVAPAYGRKRMYDLYKWQIYWTSIYVLVKYEGLNVYVFRRVDYCKTYMPFRILDIDRVEGKDDFLEQYNQEFKRSCKMLNSTKNSKMRIKTLVDILERYGWVVTKKAAHVQGFFSRVISLSKNQITINVKGMNDIMQFLAPKVNEMCLYRFNIYRVDPVLMNTFENNVMFPEEGQLEPIELTKKNGPHGETLETGTVQMNIVPEAPEMFMQEELQIEEEGPQEFEPQELQTEPVPEQKEPEPDVPVYFYYKGNFYTTPFWEL